MIQRAKEGNGDRELTCEGIQSFRRSLLLDPWEQKDGYWQILIIDRYIHTGESSTPRSV